MADGYFATGMIGKAARLKKFQIGVRIMVPALSIVFSLVSAFLAIVLPIVLSIWFCKKFHTPYSSVLVGALTFFVFQMVLRIPLIQLVSYFFPHLLPRGGVFTIHYLLYSAVLALTAGLFEEGGRFLFFKLFMRRRESWDNAVAMGIGHGGIEAMMLVGMNIVSNLIILVMINTGTLTESVKAMLGQAYYTLINTPSHMFLLGGVERVFAMIAQIGMSVMVVYSIASRKSRYFLLALLCHFLLDFPLGIFVSLFGTWGTEAYVALFAAAFLVWIIRSKELFSPIAPPSESITVE